MVEVTGDDDLTVEGRVVANSGGNGEATLTVELGVGGVSRPESGRVTLLRATQTGRLEILGALAGELRGSPESDAPVGIRGEMTTVFELRTELRGQDESTLGIQRVLKLANEQQH